MGSKRKRPMTEKEAVRRALKRGTRYRLPTMNIGVLAVSLFFCIVICVCVAVILSRGGEPDTAKPSDTQLSETEPSSKPADGELLRLELAPEEVYRGDLILVNGDHEYRFPSEPTDVSVFDNKTPSYKVNDLNVTLSMTALTPFNRLMDDFYAETGCRDVMVVSGFRTEEFQRKLYTERAESEGVETAARYVALAGHSEHHTGLAMDLSVYTDSGEGYYVRSYEKCRWLVDNFENYGFVLRYPEEKANITGIDYESWHYRYVGTPHSLIMSAEGFVLEEYLEYLQTLDKGTSLTWNGSETGFCKRGEGGAVYEVYYEPASEETTVLGLPKGRAYTVSGDNVGGFIITLMPKNGGTEK